MKSWTRYFIDLTLQVATKSKDPSRQVGCIIVGPDKEIRSTGFNGFPRGVRETQGLAGVASMVLSDRWDRPQKYLYVEHSERNAIYNAARVGIPTLGCSAFVSLAPCVDCARALVQSGITEVYAPAPPKNMPNEYHFDTAEIVLREGGVNYVVTDYAQEDTA